MKKWERAPGRAQKTRAGGALAQLQAPLLKTARCARSSSRVLKCSGALKQLEQKPSGPRLPALTSSWIRLATWQSRGPHSRGQTRCVQAPDWSTTSSSPRAIIAQHLLATNLASSQLLKGCSGSTEQARRVQSRSAVDNASCNWWSGFPRAWCSQLQFIKIKARTQSMSFDQRELRTTEQSRIKLENTRVPIGANDKGVVASKKELKEQKPPFAS